MFNRFNRNINSKVDTNIYLLIIVLLSVIVCYLQPKLILPALFIFGVIYYFSRRNIINKEIFFSSYLDNIIRNIERTNHFAVRKLDVGMAVFSKDGKLQWKNALFAQWVGKKNIDGLKPEEILPLPANAFELLSVHDGEQTLQLEDRYYSMKYYSVQTQERHSKRPDTSSGLMLYLTDVTDYELLRQKYYNDRLCLAYVRFDNYEEVMRGLSETNIANLNGEINELLTKWAASHQGFICRMNKESSLLGFSQSAVLNMMDDKFMILDRVREIRSGNKIPPTVSIGVACDGVTLEELIGNANKSLYLALGRGGDQAVVLKDKNTQFFGGTSSVGAKSTRVRARIVAQTIHEQMQQADKIFVMGHMNEDYDAIGATIGMAKLSLSLGKTTYIVQSEHNAYYRRIAEVLDNENIILSDNETKYLDIVVSEQEALANVTSKSLLVIVDHHRAVLSASKKLLEAVHNRIIVDHHRRAEDIIGDTVLLYLEPSSSSTSELVTELIGYFDDRLDITPAEATALYAGIVLDTKYFNVQTGERTFEAAALLRRSGANPNLVRQLFKDDMQLVQQRAKLIAGAKMPVAGLSIAVMYNAPNTTMSSVLAAQTADTLITIDGVAVGMAIVEYKDGSLGISARSDGSVNVQVIMEELGGGGHQTVAGVQLAGKRARDVEAQLIALTEKQLEECKTNESNSVARC
ncbi:DHH family phosphoesterase [uncultured Phascolarctobacterium sp.]|uniref:DHH family phosphoesterase n=1 Tax=uncultured Phascolarctobacterium sp. TaxID=512296 RepID=UPI0025E23FDA|nr:DHH family phosphoesterase [uncultured Phascolarctobacterium sp.]